MRAVVFGAYTVMAIWLILAGILRILISTANGIELDVLPFISGAPGLVALLILKRLLPADRSSSASRAKQQRP